jgi:tRNA (guanine-N7-)-methyltransferase
MIKYEQVICLRLRNLKNTDEILNTCEFLITDSSKYKGKWRKLFGNDNPIYIEIGMGFGKFIYENALKNPNINYIGIERFDKVIARAIKKFDKRLDNLYIIRMDAMEIENSFDKEVDLIYLNFSDPWPKKRHAKKRLTSDVFLEKYDKIFKNKKTIIMKTDNRDLFISSIESLSSYGYGLSDVSFDLHKSEEYIITTEYEEKFMGIGNPIYYLVGTKE